MANRLFTDREMGTLIRRAAQLQAMEDQGAHSLAAIQEIAAQVDIDPAVIAVLASRLVPEAPTPWSRLFGPASMELARVVPIATAVPIAELLETIRAATGHQGEAQQIATGLEWRQVHDYSKVHVSVLPSARGAVLRVGGEYKWRLVVLAGTVVPLGAIAGGALGAALSAGDPAVTAIGLAVAGAGTAVLAVRAVWANMMRRAGNQLAETLTHLQRVVTTASKQYSPSGDGAGPI